MTRFAVVSIVGSTTMDVVAKHGTDFGGCRREESICSWAICSRTAQLLIVEDATQDSRYCYSTHHMIPYWVL